MNTNSTNAPIAHTTPILAAQDRIKQARVEYNRTSPDDDDEAERRHRAIMDPAAALICSTEATTTREVEVNLWTALAHSTDHRQDDADAHDENLAALIEREATFDFAARILIGALRDLRRLGGVIMGQIIQFPTPEGAKVPSI